MSKEGAMLKGGVLSIDGTPIISVQPINSTGLCHTEDGLKIDGVNIHAADKSGIGIYVKDGKIYYGLDVLSGSNNTPTRTGQVVNITLADYNMLIKGEDIAGYDAYSQTVLYNITGVQIEGTIGYSGNKVVIEIGDNIYETSEYVYAKPVATLDRYLMYSDEDNVLYICLASKPFERQTLYLTCDDGVAMSEKSVTFEPGEWNKKKAVRLAAKTSGIHTVRIESLGGDERISFNKTQGIALYKDGVFADGVQVVGSKDMTLNKNDITLYGDSGGYVELNPVTVDLSKYTKFYAVITQSNDKSNWYSRIEANKGDGTSSYTMTFKDRIYNGIAKSGYYYLVVSAYNTSGDTETTAAVKIINNFGITKIKEIGYYAAE